MYRILACALLSLAISGARTHTATHPGAGQFRPLPLAQQKLTGLLGSRIRANTEGFLENLKTESLTGQSSGLFLDAAADAYEYNHDLQLREQMSQAASVLYSEPDSSLKPLSLPRLRVLRSQITGLLAYYRATEESKALVASQNLGKVLLSTPDTSLDSPVSAPTQLSMVNCLLLLYRASRDPAYLEAAKKRAATFRPLNLSGPVQNEFLTESLLAHRALVALYESSGDVQYLHPPLAAWEQIRSQRLSPAGAPLAAPDTPIDGCAAVAWEQLTYSLLRVTGNSKYGDRLEESVYNHMLAVQDARNGALAPALPLNGSKAFLSSSDGAIFTECQLHQAKAIASVPRLVWGQTDTGVTINLYNPGRAFFRLGRRGLIRIYLESNFPQSGQLQLHVEPASKGPAHFPLRLRVPAWSTRFDVQVRDLRLSGQPGDYVVVERDWRSGDSVRISMDLPARIASSSGSPAARYLLRGPQLLVLSKTVNPGLRDLQSALVLAPNGPLKLTNADDAALPHSWLGDQIYRVPGEADSKAQDLLLVPLADASSYRATLLAQPK